MLRTTRSSKSLQRRKSTSSTHKQDEDKALKAAISKETAHTAAVLAYTRAYDMASLTAGAQGNLLAQDLTTTTAYQQGMQIGTNIDIPGNLCHGTQPTRPLKQRHSVRFTGPDAVQGRRLAAARELNGPIAIAPTHKKAASLSILNRPRALTSNAAIPARFSPCSRSTSIGQTRDAAKSRTENYIDALEAFEEYYADQIPLSSEPSSYRKHIRKSKSMTSAVSRSISQNTIIFSDGTPAPRLKAQPSIAHNQSPLQVMCNDTTQDPPKELLRAAKSMSFLGRLPGRKQHTDEAVQLARDKYLGDISQQRLNAEPSFIFRSRSRRQQKDFRKSFRSVSAGGGLMSAGAAPVHSDGTSFGSHFREKARKVSGNLKRGFKRIFSRKLLEDSEGVAALPPQSVQSIRSHASMLGHHFFNHSPGMTITPPSDVHDIPADYVIPLLPTAPMDAVTSCQPSFQQVGSSNRLGGSRKGSLESMRSTHSLHTGRSASAVTSWNDDSVASRHAAAEKERLRLSVINENRIHLSGSGNSRMRLAAARGIRIGPQTPSSFASRHTGQSRTPRLERDGIKETLILGNGTTHDVKALDSQRIYSLLMKRLDSNSPGAKLAERLKHNASVGSFVGAEDHRKIKVPARKSSAEFSRKENTNGLIEPASGVEVRLPPRRSSRTSLKGFANTQINMQSKSDTSTPATIRKVTPMEDARTRDDDKPWISPLRFGEVSQHDRSRSLGTLSSEDDVFSLANEEPYRSLGNTAPRIPIRESSAEALIPFPANGVPKIHVQEATALDDSEIEDDMPRLPQDHPTYQPGPVMSLPPSFQHSPDSYTHGISTRGSDHSNDSMLRRDILHKRSSKGLQEVGSGMFGSGHSLIERTLSPYRQALAREGLLTSRTPDSISKIAVPKLTTTADESWGSYDPAVITGETPVRALTTTLCSDTSSDREYSTPCEEMAGDEVKVNGNPRVETELSGKKTGGYSESVYSRSTSGQTPNISQIQLIPQHNIFPLPARTRQPSLPVRETLVTQIRVYTPQSLQGTSSASQPSSSLNETIPLQSLMGNKSLSPKRTTLEQQRTSAGSSQLQERKLAEAADLLRRDRIGAAVQVPEITDIMNRSSRREKSFVVDDYPTPTGHDSQQTTGELDNDVRNSVGRAYAQDSTIGAITEDDRAEDTIRSSKVVDDGKVDTQGPSLRRSGTQTTTRTNATFSTTGSSHQRERAQLYSSEDSDGEVDPEQTSDLCRGSMSATYIKSGKPSAIIPIPIPALPTHHHAERAKSAIDQAILRSTLHVGSAAELDEHPILPTPAAIEMQDPMATMQDDPGRKSPSRPTTPIAQMTKPIAVPPPPPMPKHTPAQTPRPRPSFSIFPKTVHSNPGTPVRESISARALRIQRSNLTMRSQKSARSAQSLDLSPQNTRTPQETAKLVKRAGINHNNYKTYDTLPDGDSILTAIENQFGPVNATPGSGSAGTARWAPRRSLDERALGTAAIVVKRGENRSPNAVPLTDNTKLGGSREMNTGIPGQTAPPTFSKLLAARETFSGMSKQLTRDNGRGTSSMSSPGRKRELAKLGSARMVDSFLSSRRKRIASDASGG